MVRVEFDVQQRDKYGGLLGYVYLADGRMFNEEIVKAGYASLMAIPANVKYEGKFLKAYREAREGKKGVVGTEQQGVNMAKYSVYFFCNEC